jgi:hypothetical protein
MEPLAAVILKRCWTDAELFEFPLQTVCDTGMQMIGKTQLQLRDCIIHKRFLRIEVFTGRAGSQSLMG